MNIKTTGALTTLAAALIAIGGCASNTAPTPVAAAPSQAATAPPANTAAVTPKPATPAAQAAPAPVQPTALAVYFDYDKFDVKDQYAGVVRGNADYLVKTNGAVELDGNADERGSREYNMALGQKRADAVKRALSVLGVKTDRIETISFGEDKPKAKGHDEAAWAENRRVDFVSKGK